MIFEPVIKGSVSRVAHPYGCKKEVENQINYVKSQNSYEGPKKVLVLGASSGYGLASRISLAFGAKADTIGISFEQGISEKRLGTAGWWNNIWFKEAAEKEGLVAKNFIGDAFSNEMREQVIKYIKEEFGGEIDLLVYSLASGRRNNPVDGKTYMSSIKSTTGVVNAPTVNLEKQAIEDGIMEEATEQELNDTVVVMGGGDWQLWVEALSEAGVLSEGFKTFSESYMGPEVTYPIYKDGTLGASKRDLEEKGLEINKLVKEKVNGEAFVCVSKALVTKASAYIPLFPLYCSALFTVMKEMGNHEGCIEHKHRFLKDMMYGDKREIDSENRMRPDSWELSEEVQAKVSELMDKVTKENFKDITDFKGFLHDFMVLNGFELDGVNYQEDIDLEVLKKLEY